MKQVGKVALLSVLVPMAAARQAPTVAPGSSAVDAKRIPIGKYVVRVYATQAGTERELSSYDYELVRIKDARGDAIVNVQSSSAANGGVDSVAVDPVKLAPLWARSKNPRSSSVIDYTGDQVKGTITRNGETKAIDEKMPAPAFAGYFSDLIVGTLPLQAGYAARIPVYAPETGLMWNDIAVTGNGSFNGRDVWLVTVTSKTGVQNLSIDQRTREIVQMEMARGEMKMRITRERVK